MGCTVFQGCQLILCLFNLCLKCCYIFFYCLQLCLFIFQLLCLFFQLFFQIFICCFVCTFQSFDCIENRCDLCLDLCICLVLGIINFFCCCQCCCQFCIALCCIIFCIQFFCQLDHILQTGFLFFIRNRLIWLIRIYRLNCTFLLHDHDIADHNITVIRTALQRNGVQADISCRIQFYIFKSYTCFAADMMICLVCQLCAIIRCHRYFCMTVIFCPLCPWIIVTCHNIVGSCIQCKLVR